jgi:superfamily II helicase
MHINLCIALGSSSFKITYYHAELEPPEREKRHRDWSRGTVKLIVATVAFGMGINKPDGNDGMKQLSMLCCCCICIFFPIFFLLLF